MATSVARAPSFVGFINAIIGGLLSLGVPVGPMQLLTVRGRKTGRPITTPVALMSYSGRPHLFGTWGDSSWVRNVRAAGEVTMSRGRRRQRFTAGELTAEQAAPFLRNVIAPQLGNPVAKLVLRGRWDARPDSGEDDFIAEARRHPVFELRS
jgi:deazaflavin-dependent oxidoreductase (nitroreductase family)